MFHHIESEEQHKKEDKNVNQVKPEKKQRQ